MTDPAKYPHRVRATICPICRGVTGVIDHPDRGTLVAEHVDQTSMRCEGSFAPTTPPDPDPLPPCDDCGAEECAAIHMIDDVAGGHDYRRR